jgi:hypothetical protein
LLLNYFITYYSKSNSYESVYALVFLELWLNEVMFQEHHNKSSRSYHQIIFTRHIRCSCPTQHGHQPSYDPDSDRSTLSPKLPSTSYEIHPAPNLIMWSCHLIGPTFPFLLSDLQLTMDGFHSSSNDLDSPTLSAISQSDPLWASMIRFIKKSRRLAKPPIVS